MGELRFNRRRRGGAPAAELREHAFQTRQPQQGVRGTGDRGWQPDPPATNEAHAGEPADRPAAADDRFDGALPWRLDRLVLNRNSQPGGALDQKPPRKRRDGPAPLRGVRIARRRIANRHIADCLAPAEDRFDPFGHACAARYPSFSSARVRHQYGRAPDHAAPPGMPLSSSGVGRDIAPGPPRGVGRPPSQTRGSHPPQWARTASRHAANV